MRISSEGKIIDATELELYDYWLNQKYDKFYSFGEYLKKCQDNGTRIYNRDEVDICALTYPDCEKCTNFKNNECQYIKYLSLREYNSIIERIASLERQTKH